MKRKDLKNITEIIKTAIERTLLAQNINPEIVADYMQQAGDITYVKNTNRKATAWVNHAGRESTFYISRTFNGIDKMFDDTIGVFISDRPVKAPNDSKNYIFPAEEMVLTLSELTKKASYKYQALELCVTLDLERYKASRRIIVPADITFQRLHHILQRTFDWDNTHLYDFTVIKNHFEAPILRLVPYQEDLEYDTKAVLMENQTIKDYLQKYKEMFYTYDLGDNWEHKIELVRTIENHDQNAPYLLEASGQTPPEDVGGVGGYLYFLDILADQSHPQHNEMKEWAGYWSPELSDWKKKPRMINK